MNRKRMKDAKNPSMAWNTAELKFLSDNRDKPLEVICAELNRSRDSLHPGYRYSQNKRVRNGIQRFD